MSKNMFGIPTIMFTTKDLPGENDDPGLGGDASAQGTPHPMTFEQWLQSSYADAGLYTGDQGTDPTFDDYRVWWNTNNFPFYVWSEFYHGVSQNPGDPYP